jgi:transcriptional regulator of acetoin/glycerol metabolism
VRYDVQAVRLSGAVGPCPLTPRAVRADLSPLRGARCLGRGAPARPGAPTPAGPAQPPAPSPPLSGADSTERTTIEEALVRARGVVSRAAAEMGLSRQALYRRMERLGIALERRVR